MAISPEWQDAIGPSPASIERQMQGLQGHDPIVEAAKAGIDERLTTLDARLLTASLLEDAYNKILDDHLRISTQLQQAQQDTARAELAVSKMRQQRDMAERVALKMGDRALEAVFAGLLNGAYSPADLRALAAAVERAQRVPVSADRALQRAVTTRNGRGVG